MFTFYISKTIQSLIFPPGIILLFLLFASFYTKKYRKIFLSLTFFSYLLTTNFIGKLLISPLEKPYYKQKTTKKVSLVVALGGGAYSLTAFRRNSYALMIAKKNNIPLLFNGTKKEAIDANLTFYQFQNYLNLDIKINNNKKYEKKFLIYIVNKALNTKDNAKLTKVFLQKNHILDKPIYLVTSAYHMKRAKKEFEKMGIKVIPRATDFKAHPSNKYLDLLPSSGGLTKSYESLHEYVGLLRNYFLKI